MKRKNCLAKAENRLASQYAAQVSAVCQEITTTWEKLVTETVVGAMLCAELDDRLEVETKKAVVRELSTRNDHTLFQMLAKLGADRRLRESRG